MMPISKNARARLLSAGRQLMLARGFTGTSVDQICAEAGLTKGSFFHHFGTKDEFGEAQRVQPPRHEFDSVGLAEHFIAIYEGSLVLAKAKGAARVLADNIEHF